MINRFGFNNDGVAAIAARLAARPRAGVVGLNLGANKASPDRAADYARVLAEAGRFVDFATINVSSPNTERLRDLQGGEALRALLAGVAAGQSRAGAAGAALPQDRPGSRRRRSGRACRGGARGGDRRDRRDQHDAGPRRAEEPPCREAGGLSGAPLFARSTAVLARVHALSGGRLPLIGVGGVGSAEAAYAKIRAGASAVQLYSALVHGGLALVPRSSPASTRCSHATVSRPWPTRSGPGPAGGAQAARASSAG